MLIGVKVLFSGQTGYKLTYIVYLRDEIDKNNFLTRCFAFIIDKMCLYFKTLKNSSGSFNLMSVLCFTRNFYKTRSTAP